MCKSVIVVLILISVFTSNMARSNQNPRFVNNLKAINAMKETMFRQGSNDEAHKSIDYTKGNIYIARNELIWKTP